MTVAGWIVAPWLRLDLASVALLGLLAACGVELRRRGAPGARLGHAPVLRRRAEPRAPRRRLGIDAQAGALIQWLLGDRRPGPLGLVLAVAVVSLVVRLALEQDLTVLLVSLALIPVASAAGVEPWTVSMALLATSVAWFLPFQTSSYMVARSASEDRLFTQEQARRFALAYAGLTLLGLALAVPYWRLLGIL